jgi:hypothetical protein
MPSFTIHGVVVCDDVRKEINGKDILIGAYGGGIVVPYLPASIPIALWIELTPKNAGRLELDIRVALPGTSRGIRMVLAGDFPSGGEPSSLSTPPIMCPIGAAGNIEVSIKSHEATDWEVIKVKHVSVGIPPQPIEIQDSVPPRSDGVSTPRAPIASPQPPEPLPSDGPPTKSGTSQRRPATRRSW